MINQLQKKYQLSILLLLSIIAVLGIFPFVVIRFLASNYTVMIIDLMLIFGILTFVACAYITKKVRLINIILAIFINIGVVTVVITNGIDSFLWIYPVFASTFILVKPFEALAINIVTGILVVCLTDIFNIVSLDSFIVTLLMLSISSYVYANHSAKQFHLLETLNTVDTLTGALNRRAMNTDIAAALYTSERHGTKQLLAILDLDYFKKVNDKFGHAVGDQALKDFVRITSAHIRKYDKLYRFGGEEFVLLIPKIKEQQHEFIDNLRTAIKNELKTPDGQAITVSLGIAQWVPGTTADTWLKRADKALYSAKNKGRDCAVFSDTSEQT